MSTNYQRVIPRDLFNEAKLLKCIGRVCLLIHDNMAGRLTFEHDGEPFEIVQDDSDGSLLIRNIYFSHDGNQLSFFTKYNSKDTYPIYCNVGSEEYSVFEDDGNFTEVFFDYITS